MENIRAAFINSVDSNPVLRNKAEIQLKEIEKNSETLLYIFQNLFNDENIIVRRTSSLFIAGRYKKSFDIPELQQFANFIESRLMEMFIMADNKVTQSFSESVLMSFYEKSSTSRVLQFLNDAMQHINSEDPKFRIGGLKIGLKIFYTERFEYALKSPLEVIFDTNGANFLKGINDAYNRRDFAELSIYFKILYKTFGSFSLPVTITRSEIFSMIHGLAVNVLTFPYDPSNVSQRILVSNVYKFLHLSFASKKWKDMKKSELKKILSDPVFIKNLIGVFIGAIENFGNLHNFHPDVYLYTAYFFASIFTRNSTKKYAEEFISPVLVHFVIQGLKLDDRVRDQFQDDPKEFLSLRYDFRQHNFRQSLIKVYLSILSYSKEAKNFAIKHIIEHVTDPSYDPDFKYGLIELLAESFDHLQDVMDVSNLKSLISRLISDFLVSENIYLVSQLLYFLGSVSDITLDNSFSYETMKTIYGYLDHSSDIIKIGALLSFNMFFFNQDLHPHVASLIPVLLRKILEHNKVFYLDPLGIMMSTVVETFPEYVKSYVFEFLESIVQNIDAMLQKDEVDTLSFYEYCNVINALINNNRNNKEIVLKMFHYCSKFIYNVVQAEYYDVLEEVVDLLNTFLFILENVDDYSYQLFMRIIKLDPDELVLIIDNIACFIDNFFSFCHNSMISDDLLNRIIELFKNFLSDSQTELAEIDFRAVCNLMISILSYKGPMLAQQFPYFVSCIFSEIYSLKTVIDSSTDVDYVLAMKVFMNCYISSQELTMHLLDSFSYRDFFTEIIRNASKFVLVIDKKTMILFLGSLFDSKIEIDPVLLNEALYITITTLPKAIEKRNALIDRENNDTVNEDIDADLVSDNLEYDAYANVDAEEDIYSVLPLYNWNPYEFIKQKFSNPVKGTLGESLLKNLKQYEIEKFKEIFSKSYPHEKTIS